MFPNPVGKPSSTTDTDVLLTAGILGNWEYSLFIIRMRSSVVWICTEAKAEDKPKKKKKKKKATLGGLVSALVVLWMDWWDDVPLFLGCTDCRNRRQ